MSVSDGQTVVDTVVELKLPLNPVMFFPKAFWWDFGNEHYVSITDMASAFVYLESMKNARAAQRRIAHAVS